MKICIVNIGVKIIFYFGVDILLAHRCCFGFYKKQMPNMAPGHTVPGATSRLRMHRIGKFSGAEIINGDIFG